MKSVDPSLTADRAKQVLKQSSKPLTCDVNACGAGIVNAASALAQLQGKQEPIVKPLAEACAQAPDPCRTCWLRDQPGC